MIVAAASPNLEGLLAIGAETTFHIYIFYLRAIVGIINERSSCSGEYFGSKRRAVIASHLRVLLVRSGQTGFGISG